VFVAQLKLSRAEDDLRAARAVVDAVTGPLRDTLKKMFPEPIMSLPIDIRISSGQKASLSMHLDDDPEVGGGVEVID
jgi:hypothetical protein